jgi:preprotein translocase subunit YajC
MNNMGRKNPWPPSGPTIIAMVLVFFTAFSIYMEREERQRMTQTQEALP